MKKIKVSLKPEHKVINNGTCYVTKLNNDYGVPTMRKSIDTSSQNVALRSGLTKPKKAKRDQEKAQIDKKDLKSFGQDIEARNLAMSQKIWELN